MIYYFLPASATTIASLNELSIPDLVLVMDDFQLTSLSDIDFELQKIVFLLL